MNTVRKLCAAIMLFVVILALSGCCLSHEWEEADCTQPKTCVKCGETEGEALPHDWKAATCTAPKTCKDCGATEGEPKTHAWKDATCAAPKTCKDCGETEGETLEHSWKEADCEAPETCSGCGETKGEALGHIDGETKVGKTDCVNAVTRWDTYCQRCGEVTSTRNEEMTSLHKNKTFLMSPQDLEDRLNQKLELVPSLNLQADIRVADGKLGVVISSNNQYVGHFSMYNAKYDGTDDYYIYSGMENEQGCFDTVVGLFYNDFDRVVNIVASAVLTLDPSLDLLENVDEVTTVVNGILGRQSYQYHGLNYAFAEYEEDCLLVVDIAW